MTLLRIMAPKFTAGVVVQEGRVTRAAPCLTSTIGWTRQQVEAHCEKNGWQCQRVGG